MQRLRKQIIIATWLLLLFSFAENKHNSPYHFVQVHAQKPDNIQLVPLSFSFRPQRLFYSTLSSKDNVYKIKIQINNIKEETVKSTYRNQRTINKVT